MTKEYLSDDEMAGHDLTEEERAVLRIADLEALYRLGANSYLIRRVFRSWFKI